MSATYPKIKDLEVSDGWDVMRDAWDVMRDA